MMKTIAILLGLAAASMAPPAFAAKGGAATIEDAAATLAPDAWVWGDDARVAGPLSVVVSIPDQRAYVYRGDAIVAAASVSTGKGGKETPLGTYTILQKQVAHKSNKYDSASMPYMERLTWDGVAIHAGSNPGFPTSHGCIHVPTAFAKKLYGQTRIGTAVTVVDSSVVEGPSAAEIAAEAQAETARANQVQLQTMDVY